jgi:hypothetical protein
VSQPDGARAAWQQLDIEIEPGRYHFPPQAPRVSMRFRRAAVMRGYETQMGTPGVAAVTLTVHDRPRPGHTPVADADLPEFDVTLDGDLSPRST